jgi:hypothetical protein
MTETSNPYKRIAEAVTQATSLAANATGLGRKGLIEQGLVVEAYGTLLKLESLLPVARAAISREPERQSEDPRPGRPNEPTALLFVELMHFFETIGRLNAALVDVYYPGLAARLREAYGEDIEMSHYLAQYIEPHYAIKPEHRALIDNLMDGPHGGWFDYRYYRYGRVERHQDGPALLEAVERLLPECKTELGRLIRDNWQLRDFVEQSADIKIDVGSIDASTGKVTIAHGATVHGGVVSAMGSTVSLTAQSSTSNDSIVALIPLFLSAISELKVKMEPSMAAQVAADIHRLEEETALSKPRKAWYELTVTSLKEALSALGAVAGPAISIADKILDALRRHVGP